MTSRRFAKLALSLLAAALFGACGGQVDDDDDDDGEPIGSPVSGTFRGYPDNVAADTFDRTLDVTASNGNAPVTDGGATTTYRLRYDSSTARCSVSGGSGASELSQCAAVAGGRVLALCAPSATAAALVLQSTSGLTALTFAELKAVTGPNGIVFDAIGCDGKAIEGEAIRFDRDGQITSQASGAEQLSPAQAEAAFSATGQTFAGDVQLGLRAFRHSAGGVQSYLLLRFGKPLAGSTLERYEPRVLRSR